MIENLVYLVFFAVYFIVTTIWNFVIWFQFSKYQEWVQDRHAKLASKNVPTTTYFLKQIDKTSTKWVMRMISLVAWLVGLFLTFLFLILVIMGSA